MRRISSRPQGKRLAVARWRVVEGVAGVEGDRLLQRRRAVVVEEGRGLGGRDQRGHVEACRRHGTSRSRRRPCRRRRFCTGSLPKPPSPGTGTPHRHRRPVGPGGEIVAGDRLRRGLVVGAGVVVAVEAAVGGTRCAPGRGGTGHALPRRRIAEGQHVLRARLDVEQLLLAERELVGEQGIELVFASAPGSPCRAPGPGSWACAASPRRSRTREGAVLRRAVAGPAGHVRQREVRAWRDRQAQPQNVRHAAQHAGTVEAVDIGGDQGVAAAAGPSSRAPRRAGLVSATNSGSFRRSLRNVLSGRA